MPYAFALDEPHTHTLSSPNTFGSSDYPNLASLQLRLEPGYSFSLQNQAMHFGNNDSIMKKVKKAMKLDYFG